MKISTRSLPLMCALLLAFACEEDDDVGAKPRTKCVGAYADKTPADLAAQANTGACADDTAALCGSDVPMHAHACGVAARSQAANPNDRVELTMLTLSCLQTELDSAPSDMCLDCYLQSVACTGEKCFAECVGGETPACQRCRIDTTCAGRFYQCTGLPIPTGLDLSTSRGGAGGASGIHGSGGSPGSSGGAFSSEATAGAAEGGIGGA